MFWCPSWDNYTIFASCSSIPIFIGFYKSWSTCWCFTFSFLISSPLVDLASVFVYLLASSAGKIALNLCCRRINHCCYWWYINRFCLKWIDMLKNFIKNAGYVDGEDILKMTRKRQNQRKLVPSKGYYQNAFGCIY